jgi:hypothetical protein
LTTTCKKDRRINEPHSFKEDEFADAWKKGDTTTVDLWFSSLTDTLNDSSFFSRVYQIASVTGFYYCIADSIETNYWKEPLSQRPARKRNIAKVYHLYRHSCMFPRKTTRYELPFQDRYIEDSTDVSQLHLEAMRFEITNMCNRGIIKKFTEPMRREIVAPSFQRVLFGDTVIFNMRGKDRFIEGKAIEENWNEVELLFWDTDFLLSPYDGDSDEIQTDWKGLDSYYVLENHIYRCLLGVNKDGRVALVQGVIIEVDPNAPPLPAPRARPKTND